MNWQYTDSSHTSLVGTNDDGTTSSCLVAAPEVQAWIAQGNTPAASNPPSVDYKGLAQAALAASDRTVIRCAEHGVTVPSAWTGYRATLRTIVNGTAQGPLPSEPSYPVGT
jgi:hypothetical protein